MTLQTPSYSRIAAPWNSQPPRSSSGLRARRLLRNKDKVSPAHRRPHAPKMPGKPSSHIGVKPVFALSSVLLVFIVAMPEVCAMDLAAAVSIRCVPPCVRLSLVRAHAVPGRQNVRVSS